MNKYDPDSMKNIISERQFNILKYIAEETSKNHYPPSVREICSALNIKSTSTVHKEIANLSTMEFLEKNLSPTRKTRAISLSEKGKKLLDINDNISDESTITSSVYNKNYDIVDIPVIGHIAAGTPIFAEENIEDSIPLPSRFIGRGDNFMLRVRGDSMEGVGIMNKDFILVEETSDVNNGDIVVAIFHNQGESEATVKTYYKKNGHVELHPENPDYSVIDGDGAEIVGRVCGVFRYM